MNNIEDYEENIDGYLSPDNGDNNQELLELVSLILKKNGVDSITSSVFTDRHIDAKINTIIENEGFNENIEQAIIDFWEDSFYNEKDKFIANFISDFHYSILEKYTDDYVSTLNNKITEAFNNIVNYIFRLNSGLDQNELATSIIIDRKADSINELQQILTPYCSILLLSDNTGTLYIMVSIDYEIEELLDISLMSLFLRNIFKFTDGDISPYLIVAGLNIDCQSEFIKHKNASAFQENYKVFIGDENIEYDNVDKINFDYSYLTGKYTCNLTDYTWRKKEEKYIDQKEFSEKANLNIEGKMISFKRPDSDWLEVSLTFDKADVEKDKLVFHDNYNQKLLLDYEKTKLIWFYEFDGERYLKCAVYSEINEIEL